jgi:endonuclease/exonuclease/phosphatase family metal-dependent hydrolase
LISQLKNLTADNPKTPLCFQEVVHKQVVDLQAGLGSEWTHIGVGRDDGKEAGEYSPIFYQPGVWTILQNRTYWLSENPDVVGSVGWGAALPRIVTVVRLRHVDSGAPFVYMCTYFDNRGQIARENSAKLLFGLVHEWEGAAADVKAPVFLAGDINVPPNNAAYRTLVSSGALYDTKDLVPKSERFGGPNTFTGFTESTSDDTEIDHMFVDSTDSVRLMTHRVVDNRVNGEIYISDHRVVVVDLVWTVMQVKGRAE